MIGPLAIILCMILRASDILFRSKTLLLLSPIQIVTAEHLIACLILLPLFPRLAVLKNLHRKDWAALIFVSCASSVGGILAFTSAFHYINPTVVVLLQKLQPIVSIVLSMIILKERPRMPFYLWSAIAIAAGLILSANFEFDAPFPYLSSQPLNFSSETLKGIGFSLLATIFWGSGTVFGKILLQKMNNATLTKLRYFFGGIFALLLFFLIPQDPTSLSLSQIFSDQKLLLNISYMAIFTGLIPLSLFYYGLNTTSPSVSAICELFYPLTTLVLGSYLLHQPLALYQVCAASILFLAINKISFSQRKA
jgi:drug/metabolite transporter (DMT)-like permease